MDASDFPYVVPLQGGSNFRDLGGHRTGDGRTVRRGAVFRSAHLGVNQPEITMSQKIIRLQFDGPLGLLLRSRIVSRQEKTEFAVGVNVEGERIQFFCSLQFFRRLLDPSDVS